MSGPVATLFSRQQDLIGEGPLWSATEQALYWIDIAGLRLHRRALDGEALNWDLPGPPGCVAELAGGGLAMTVGEGLYAFDPVTGDGRSLAALPLADGARFNEGKVDPQGRLWAGSMQNNLGPDGQGLPVDRRCGILWRLDPDGRAETIETDIGISNTLAWSPDGRRFHFADSLRNVLWVYDFDPDSGAVANRRVFFDEAGYGEPDGSAMDADGCLWNARWGAGVVLRLTPEGQIDRVVEIPAPQPSSCAFGGPDLDTLFVTTARMGLDAGALAKAPLSGSVFALPGAARGAPIPPMRWLGADG